ncbi:SHOCT domain-containing protein [Streptomyces sp. NPDC101206]|uniref:SHOCT domain-containing protein n=1 Tax=Streptomyces sp. NPDC101206 TaxID=3366128 RepID=UPI003830A241
MFIRPVGPVVHPAQRPAGRPLLRGILARGAYVWDAAQLPVRPAQHDADAAGPPPFAGAAGDAEAPAAPATAEAVDTGEEAHAGAEVGAGAGAGPGAGPSPEPAAANAGGALTAHLTQLAALAREGLLTPEEFTAAKSRLLKP